MEIKEFISSGLIEVYCLGMASDEEKLLVERFASRHAEVRREIKEVSDALLSLERSESISPPEALRDKILSQINFLEMQQSFPPRITLHSTTDEWLRYLSGNNISAPVDYEQIHLQDLPGNEYQTTYVVWAKKGAVVEESHADEEEFLLMLRGNCSVIINGKTGYYKEGDIVFIPKGAVHRAEVLSDEPMLIIGQRIAA